MPFCSNCGKEIIANEKFCTNCGQAVNALNEQRSVVYEGKVHKCPNCGELVNSFLTKCVSCGFEFRQAEATYSVSELSKKLEEIERQRVFTKQKSRLNPFALLDQQKNINPIDEKKINLIKNYPIPNTKEDLLEFMILAASNVTSSGIDWSRTPTAGQLAMFDAWKSKMEQAYEKAKLSFSSENEFIEISNLYKSALKKVKSSKNKIWKILGIIYGGLILFTIIILLITSISAKADEKKELARLDAVDSKIQQELNDGEYKYALMYAETLVYDAPNKDEHYNEWIIKREKWYDKIISEAAKNNVVLERPIDEPETTAEGETTLSSKEQISQNVSEFKDSVSHAKETWDTAVNSTTEEVNQ